MPILRNLATGALVAGARFLERASNALTAVAAGVCGEEDLLDRSQRHWDRTFGPFYQDHDIFAGLMEWEKRVYDAYLPGRKRIGLIGCGPGRDLIALGQLGHEVEGVEISRQAAEMAKSHLAEAGIQGTVHCGDISRFVFPGEQYDAFIFSWFTYIFVPHANRRIQMLKKIRPKLAPDGCIILFFIATREHRSRPFIELARWVARVTRNPQPPELGDDFAQDLHYSHAFTREEIFTEAEAAQFEVVHYEEGSGSDAAVLKPKLT